MSIILVAMARHDGVNGKEDYPHRIIFLVGFRRFNCSFRE
jgi:hypothetical protein